MISIYNAATATWEIKRLADLGMQLNKVDTEKYIDVEKVAAAWNWISLNGVYIEHGNSVYYDGKSVLQAFKLISFK